MFTPNYATGTQNRVPGVFTLLSSPQSLLSLMIVQATTSSAQQYGGNQAGSGGSTHDGTSGPAAGSLFDYTKYQTILLAHAITACAVWVVLIPMGGIVLRLGLQSRWVLRIHSLLQVTSYLAYIAAVGLGIWLAKTFDYPGFSMWDDPHVRLGLAILALAFFMPFFGYVHHWLFVRRLANVKAGVTSRPPGRTSIGRLHLWLGRVLIVLGIVNGGLGIRLAGQIQYQDTSTTKAATVGYSIGAGVIFLTYLLFVVVFEFKRRKTMTILTVHSESRAGMWEERKRNRRSQAVENGSQGGIVMEQRNRRSSRHSSRRRHGSRSASRHSKRSARYA